MLVFCIKVYFEEVLQDVPSSGYLRELCEKGKACWFVVQHYRSIMNVLITEITLNT